MPDMMTFPDTVDEFMEQYKMVDTHEVYSNGCEYVPIFRMQQWFEHERAKMNDHTNKCYVSIAEAYNTLTEYYHHRNDIQRAALLEALLKVPPADVEPVRHGQWLPYEFEAKPYKFGKQMWAKCSHCGTAVQRRDNSLSEHILNFCPICGTKMDGAKIRLPIIHQCATCRWSPPSSSDGKPCCACDPSDPLTSAYEPKEGSDK